MTHCAPTPCCADRATWWFQHRRVAVHCCERLRTQFHLHRVDLRDGIECHYRFSNHGWSGEETRWLINVPAVFSALAAPAGTHKVIGAPQAGEVNVVELRRIGATALPTGLRLRLVVTCPRNRLVGERPQTYRR